MIMNDTESLEATITSIDTWLDRHVDHFDPLAWMTDAKRYLRCKAVLEASLYLYVSEAVGDAPPPNLHELVISRVNDPRYHGLLRREPGQILKYAYPFAYAKHVDQLSPDAEEALADALAEQSVLATERPPHRMLDLWHFCRMYGVQPPGPELSRIVELSSLANLPDPVTATDEDAYGLTHNIMFYHNFGAQNDAFPDSPSQYDTRAVLTGLLLRYLHAENYDIAAELLFAGVLESSLPPAVVRFATEQLIDAIDEHGVVPGPKTAEYLAETDEPDPTREWELNYHTMAVVGMTFRTLDKEWADIVSPSTTHEQVVSDGDTNVLTLMGGLLHALAEYELEEAAKHLEALPSESVDLPVLQFGLEFLQRHRREDGTFGYWTDEEAVYTSLGRTPESFHERLVHPTSARLHRAVAKFSVYDDHSDELSQPK
jgi:hypothetical protein